MEIVANWFFEENVLESGEYAQMRGQSSSESFKDVYRKCLLVSLASARRQSATCKLILYTNTPLSDKTPTARALKHWLHALEVDVSIIEFSARPPAQWSRQWINQFFVFDILRDQCQTLTPEDQFVLLDSDVIWAQDSQQSSLWPDLRRQGTLTYVVPYLAMEPVNGLSRTEAGDWLRDEAGINWEGPSNYAGGEFIAVTAASISGLVDAFDRLWPRNLLAWAEGRNFLTEEAHLLSAAYAVCGVPMGGANHHIKRCWTQLLKYKNTSEEDARLTLWHLPAEKRYGFPRLSNYIQDLGPDAFLKLRSEDWRLTAAKSLGLTRTHRAKTILDVADLVRGRLGDPSR